MAGASGARQQLYGSEQLQRPAAGMLDSLLKSSAGAVVTEEGHVMRRSFSDSGRMQYHLEAPPASGAPLSGAPPSHVEQGAPPDHPTLLPPNSEYCLRAGCSSMAGHR